MPQQFRGLLIAVVLLGALVGGYFWSEKDTKANEGKPAKDAAPKILQIPENEITRIEFRKKGAEVTTVQRKGHVTWELTSPKPLRADTDAVTPVLNLLSSLSSDNLVEEKVQDWSPFGLKEPGFEIVVTKKDGKTATLQIGDDLPAGSSIYARVAGEPRLFTLASFNRSSLDKSWKDLRDKRLVTVDNEKLSRFELVSGGASVEFGKNPSNEWQIVKPNPFRADNFAVEEAARKLRELKMDANLSDEDAKKYEKAFDGAAPVGIAKLTDAAGTQQVEVRKAKAKVDAKADAKADNSETVYYAKASAAEGIHKVAADVAAVLEKKAEDYRNKKLFEFGFNDPSKVEIKLDGAVKSYGKSGEKWYLNGKEMKPETVQNLIDKLRDLSAVKFTAGSKEAAAIEITVVSNDGKRTEIVKISGTLAARGDEPFQYDVGATAVDDIRKAANDIAIVEPPKPPPPAGAGGKKK